MFLFIILMEDFSFSYPKSFIPLFLEDPRSFDFISNGKTYVVPLSFAKFFAPVILSNQEFINAERFIFNIDDPQNCFQILVNLKDGNEIILNNDNCVVILAYATVLNNIDLINIAQNFIRSITQTSTVSRIAEEKIKYKLNLDCEIEFIVQNIAKIAINNVNIAEILFPILKNKSEPSLNEIVISLIRKDNSKWSKFFEYIDFSSMKIPEKISIIQIVHPDFIPNTFKCSLLQYQAPIGNHLSYESGKEFQGIVQHLRDAFNGNPAAKGIIKLTASSNSSNMNIIFESSEDWYTSENSDGSWVCLEFPNHNVQIDAYTIKSYNHSSNDGHLKNWDIEGSNDKINWVIIDSKRNTTELNGPNKFFTYQCELSQPFKNIRLIMKGVTHSGYNWMYLQRLELFGIIIDE